MSTKDFYLSRLHQVHLKMSVFRANTLEHCGVIDSKVRDRNEDFLRATLEVLDGPLSLSGLGTSEHSAYWRVLGYYC